MKRIVTLTAMLVSCFFSFGQNAFKGQIIDAATKQAVTEANIVLVSLPDSTLIKGAISDSKGFFELINPSKQTNLALKILHLEYKTKSIAAKTTELGTIALEKSLQELKEVVVSTNKTIMKQKGTAVITDIASSTLKKMPKMEMLLSFLPGVSISYTHGGYEVFGKRNIIYYINKRKVNSDEISTLSPKDIESIELETQPGAEYDNNIGAVIRIHLKKKQGEGLSGEISNEFRFIRGNQELLYANLNYRMGKTDIFSTVITSLFYNQRNDQYQELEVDTPAHNWKVITEDIKKNNSKTLYGKLGINHEINDKHSVGALVWHEISPISGHSFADQSVKTYRSGSLVNNGFNNYDYFNQNKSIKVSAYYSGLLSDKLKLKTDVDYQRINSDNTSNILEKNLLINSRQTIDKNSQAHLDYIYVKNALTQVVGKNTFSYGVELSSTMRDESYKDNVLNTSFVENKDFRSSAFVSFSRPIGKMNLKAGMRYEYLDLEYLENKVKNDVKSRTYSNWLPNVSLNFPWDKTQMTLSYAKKIKRPAFYQLSDALTYQSSFLYSRGNASLRPVLTDEVSLLATYKNISTWITYSHIKDDYYSDYKLLASNPNVLEESIRNYDDYQKLKIGVSLYHKIGKWAPKLNLTYEKQFANAVFQTNRPIFNMELTNQFLISDNWFALLVINYNTKGSNNIRYLEDDILFTGGALVRTFFNKSLEVYCAAFDIFGTTDYKYKIEHPHITNRVHRIKEQQYIKIGLTYKFNSTNNKYKGINTDDKVQ